MVAAILLAFIGFGLVLWGAGLFNFTGTEQSAKIVAASLALVGGLIGSLISIIGVVLKHSLDLRNTELKEQEERRLTIESERNNDLKRDAEDRLALSTAIQAVQLLGFNTGEEVPMVQRAGALFALTSLGRYDLATVLTGQMLASDPQDLEANSAAWILDRVLTSGGRNVQEEAAMVLHSYAKKFLMSDGLATFPDSILNWEMEKLPRLARYNCLVGLGSLMVAQPHWKWDQDILKGILKSFAIAWTQERDPKLRNDVGVIMKAAFSYFKEDWVFPHRSRALDTQTIRSEVNTLTTESYGINSLADRIVEWANESPPATVPESPKPPPESSV
jgi:hypothetical protein